MTSIELASRNDGLREQRLPKAELGERAFHLTEDYREALSKLPEFTEALSYAFLGTTPEERKDLAELTVRFRREGHEYVVSRDVAGFPREVSLLRVDKIPYATPSTTAETVVLEYSRHGITQPRLSGRVKYVARNYITEGLMEKHSDTPTAVRKAEEFLRELQGLPEQPRP